MKNLKLILIFFYTISFAAIAQPDTNPIPAGNQQYCAKLKNGRITVLSGTNEISADIILDNGNIIRTYGSILKTDGSITVLRDGECVDSEGKPIKPKNKAQLKKQENEIVFPREF